MNVENTSTKSHILYIKTLNTRHEKFPLETLFNVVEQIVKILPLFLAFTCRSNINHYC